MGENKGKGTKGRSYDELTGVGTSAAGKAGNLGADYRDEEADELGNRQAGDQGKLQTGQRQQPGPDEQAGRSRQSGQQSGQGRQSGPDSGGSQQSDRDPRSGGQGRQSGGGQQSGPGKQSDQWGRDNDDEV